MSYSEHITLKNIDMKCNIFFDIAITEYDKLANFTFENIKVEAKNAAYNKSIIDGVTFQNVVVNGKTLR